MKENKKYQFELLVNKKNPKPNAPKYEIKTIKELYAILNKENYKRFLKDFNQGIEIAVAFKELAKTVDETVKLSEKKSIMDLESFTWIDD